METTIINTHKDAMAPDAGGDKRGRPPLDYENHRSGDRLLIVYRIPQPKSTPNEWLTVAPDLATIVAQRERRDRSTRRGRPLSDHDHHL